MDNVFFDVYIIFNKFSVDVKLISNWEQYKNENKTKTNRTSFI